MEQDQVSLTEYSMVGQVLLSSARKAWIVAEWPGSILLGEDKQQRGCREEECAE